MTEEIQATAPAEQEAVVEQQVEEAAPPPEPEPRRTARQALERAFATEAPEKPAEPASEPENGPQRGPDGKFVSKGPTTETLDGQKQAEQPKPVNFTDPPARFSADAKQAWQQAPEPVRAEIHRMQRELEQGLQQKDAQLEPLKPFMKMAEESGTNLKDALTNYVNMENILRENPRKGMELLARNFGMSLDQFIGQVSGQQQGQGDPRDQKIAQLEQKLSQFEQRFGQVSQTVEQQRADSINRTVEEFAAQPGHERFNELAEDMVKMLQTGFASDLADAYEKAARLNPAPAPAPVVEQKPAAPAQTRQPRSLTGAPSPGSDPTMNRTPSKNPREALQRHLFG